MNSNAATSLTKALTILQSFSDQKPELAISEISAATGMNASTIHRLLAAMQAQGFVSKSGESGQYRLGLKTLDLARIVLNQMPVRLKAIPHLEALAERTGANANLAVLNGAEIVYVYRVSSPKFRDYREHFGRLAPPHASALGKAILAYHPFETVKEMLGETEFLRFTPSTICTLDGLLEELDLVAKRGYAIDSEEFMLGSHCLAAPIRDSSGEVRASISISSTRTYIDGREVLSFDEVVLETASKISHDLGFSLYTPWPDSSVSLDKATRHG